MSFTGAISPPKNPQSYTQQIKNKGLPICLLGIGVILTALGIVLQIVWQGQSALSTFGKVSTTIGTALTLTACMILIFKKCTHKNQLITHLSSISVAEKNANMAIKTGNLDSDKHSIKYVKMKPQSIGLETNKQRTKRLRKTEEQNTRQQTAEQRYKANKDAKKVHDRNTRLQAVEKRLNPK